ncbi:hypothetical protein JCM17380_25430 [Desulfosporosinus burensis]
MKLNGKGIFELALVAFCALFFIVSFRYNPKARLAPEIFSAALFLLASLLFLGDNVPFFQKRLKFMNEKGFFTDIQKKEEDLASKENKGTVVVNENVKLIRILLWLVGFLVALRFVTYLIAVPVWLLFFTKIEGDRKWRESAYLALGMGIFDFVLFDLFLHVTF